MRWNLTRHALQSQLACLYWSSSKVTERGSLDPDIQVRIHAKTWRVFNSSLIVLCNCGWRASKYCTLQFVGINLLAVTYLKKHPLLWMAHPTNRLTSSLSPPPPPACSAVSSTLFFHLWQDKIHKFSSDYTSDWFLLQNIVVHKSGMKSIYIKQHTLWSSEGTSCWTSDFFTSLIEFVKLPISSNPIQVINGNVAKTIDLIIIDWLPY